MLSRIGTFLRSGRGPVMQFALLSFFVTAATTAALVVVISYHFRQDLLEREWTLTAAFIRKEAGTHLSASDFAAPFTPQAQRRFRAFYDEVILMPEITRVKIYDADMKVVWSDEARLIGQRFSDNKELLGALGGRTMVNIEVSDRKGENVYEQDLSLVEVYVPIIFPHSTQPVGVVETYKSPEQVFANVRSIKVTVAATALLGASLLYIALVYIVRRSAVRIEQQQLALAERSDQLATANDELRTMQDQLIATERMAAIGEVVTAIAHGIRNPLANIRAAIQVALLRVPLESRSTAAHDLANVIQEVDRLEARVRELFQFVEPAKQRKILLDVNAVVTGALQMMVGQPGSVDVKLVERLGRGLPLIPGDPMLLQQAILNILENARDAVGSGVGSIGVATGVEPNGRPDGTVFIEITDSGPGIPTESLPKIFAPFYTTKPKGTGLGLALAKKFIEASGGTLTATNRSGGGAVFRATFPSGASS
jgi:two-component system, NtrC family, sensor histidine kinase HydH